MLKKQVIIGERYNVRLHGNYTIVRIVGPSQYGGYDAINEATNRKVRIKSAAKLRSVAE